MVAKRNWEELDEILQQIARCKETPVETADPARERHHVDALRYWTTRYAERRAELA